MEKKVNKKLVPTKTASVKSAADEPILELDGPFAAPVGKTEKPKTVEAKIADPARATPTPAVERKAAKAALKKASKPTADPFAEIASEAVAEKPKAVRRKKAISAKAPTSPVAVAVKTPKARKTVTKPRVDSPSPDVISEIAAAEPVVEISPVFKALADVTLPEVPRENRARLLMQSPTRAYFYWSLRDNPWKQLHQAFGDQGSYTLVLKLINLTARTEDLYPAEAEGEWWFDVQPDTEYQVELGFYAANRPYFRVVHSNTIHTPRRSPSPHPASDARWTVSATKFAEVLDVAGFTRDAFDVAIVGDDQDGSDHATRSAYRNLTGSEDGIDGVPAEDIRHALVSIAAGATLEDLRFQTTAPLFASLQANADKLTSEAARSAVVEHFEIEEAEWTEYETRSAVFGASLVHFPRTLKTRSLTSRYNPLSSHSVLS